MVTFLYPVPTPRAVGVLGEILPVKSFIPADAGGDDIDVGTEVEDTPTFMGAGGSGLEVDDGVGGSGLVEPYGGGGRGLVVDDGRDLVVVGGVDGSGLVDEGGVSGSGLVADSAVAGGGGFETADGVGGSGFVIGDDASLATLDVDSVIDDVKDLFDNIDAVRSSSSISELVSLDDSPIVLTSLLLT